MASTDVPKLGETKLRFQREFLLRLYPQVDVRLETREILGFGEGPVIAWGRDALHEERSGRIAGRTSEGSLLPFLELESASDEDIQRFARKWGVLGVLPHVTEDAFNHAEPVAVWREVIRQSAALMRVAAAEIDGKEADRPDILTMLLGNSWHTPDADALDRTWDTALRITGYDPKMVKAYISYALSMWMSAAGVTPVIDWGVVDKTRKGVANIRFGQTVEDAVSRIDRWDVAACSGGSAGWEMQVKRWNHKPIGSYQRVSPLFAALVVQMANALSSPAGIRRCSICKKLFIPQRKCRANTEGRFCRPECKAVQQQEWSRNYYWEQVMKSGKGASRGNYNPRAKEGGEEK